MLAASLCVILLFQVNSISGQIYQINKINLNDNVQAINPYGSHVQIFDSTDHGRPYPWWWEMVKNLTIQSNTTTQAVQVISPWGNGSGIFQLNTIPTQSNVNTPLRTLLKNWFFRQPAQPNIQVLTLGGRALAEKQYLHELNPTHVLLPRRRATAGRRHQQRRILMRNLRSGEVMLMNTQTLRMPFYEDDWDIETSYSG
ncbi:uncharacterized protein [Drosophila pseudoobscura]|uniref:Uncharacterized protein n=1 Tax=Drosophila pseudoobscura pseudoobscura TaxID=46245 RepID=A0A6I8VF21_DROPS|nr:uncharacterized protein LOC26532905 [Drosophila pseudoobscura]